MSESENDNEEAQADEEVTEEETPAAAEEAPETDEEEQTEETEAETDAAEEADADPEPETGTGTADDDPAADVDAGEADDEEEDAGPRFDEDVMPDEEADLLIPVEDYLSAGVHIGTQQKTKDMERFIHRVRDDGLYVLDVSQTDGRIRTAANFLSGYDPEQVLVTSSRQYGRFPAEKFAEAIGARARTGRFIPGTLTNPEYAGYIEPDVVVVTDPIGDAQAVKEAITVGIPVIAMCDSNNQLSNVDLVIPTNNKGRRALSVVYWLLANETLDRRGAEPDYALDEFEADL
ncbi:30S ribosomal protein S2 [Candidatus Halobonum tyrrellensis]|uniref:Small ribosomal subunit protein uS2 n=1 Tax=Candidatus Halobonum tyrrellensis G22 TaxID=1324957 RepID=V4J214_9EURY|nr:30S ribosomal protein S2 [Candidatus Halobonum tyrrellensis]ESP89462.1 30S ribosomal protein S2 [Candidatus Halobonum tyrrellensis G22]